MKDRILEIFSLEWDKEFEFRESCGFTFAFEKNLLMFEGKIASAEIKPVAIIYKENGEFYLAPLDKVGDIEEIIKKYVKNFHN